MVHIYIYIYIFVNFYVGIEGELVKGRERERVNQNTERGHDISTQFESNYQKIIMRISIKYIRTYKSKTHIT